MAPGYIQEFFPVTSEAVIKKKLTYLKQKDRLDLFFEITQKKRKET